MFLALVGGYLLGITSERKLVMELQCNMALRWFVGLNLDQDTWDASTFSQNRRRRFDQAGLLERLFDDTVKRAMAEGLVSRHVSADGTLVVHADFSTYAGGEGNDMIVDSRGYAHVGNFGFDYGARTRHEPAAMLYAPPGPPSTSIVSFCADGTLAGVSDPVIFPNGMVVLDGRTLVVAESLAFRLTAFTITDAGALSDPRTWAPMIPAWQWNALRAHGVRGRAMRWISTLFDKPAIAKRSASPIAPDGIALGPDGSVWIANALRGECVRVAEGGIVLERHPVEQIALSCVLGGSDGQTLFVSTVPDLDREVAGRLRRGALVAVDLTG